MNIENQTLNPSSSVGMSDEVTLAILDVLKNVCKGDFEARIKDISDADTMEVSVCHQINEMIDRFDAYIRESTACLGFIEKNQYFRRIAKNGMVGSFGDAASQINIAADGIENKMQEFESIVESISAASTQLNSSAGTLSKSAEEATNKTASVSASAEHAGANTQTVASAAEQLNGSIQEINHQVTFSSEKASEAVVKAERTNELVNGLLEASKKIDMVVKLINDIASRTNLLALNATIEAARAGDAGRGFAVVASEVKSLANQTASATDDIKSQVSEIQNATDQAVISIGDIGEAITELNEVSASIAAAIEEQGAATQEIARNIDEVSSRVSEVSTSMIDVNGNVTMVSEVSGEILTVGTDLAEKAQKLTAVLTGTQ